MRTSLELFILALVQRNVGTPYELRNKTGVSLGSATPVLVRLEKEGLIKGSEPGSRRSRKFSLTAKGAKALEQEWAEHLETRPTDVDSILRIAFLGWLHGAEDKTAKFMATAADGLRGWAGSLQAEAERLAATLGVEPDGDAYKWLRACYEARKAEADAVALVELAGQIKNKTKNRKKPSPKHR